MKHWMKTVVFAMMCALPAGACMSAQADERPAEPPAVETQVEIDRSVLDVQPGADNAASGGDNCLGEFTCPTTGREYLFFTCPNVAWAYRACDAACEPACVRS